ncbi:MAG: MFS transporter [Parasphingorhabdus sp.]
MNGELAHRVKADRLTVPILVAYAAPSVASYFFFGTIGLYLLKFATDTLLLAPALVGTIFGVARIWDAVSDPVIGFASDKTRSSLGRRRPWMLYSILPMALFYYAIWNPADQLQGAALSLWFGVSIFLFFTAATAFSVPHNALGAELSQNYHERSRIYGAKALCEQIGIILAAVWLFQIEQAQSPKGIAMDGAILAGGVLALSVVWAVWKLREPDSHKGRGGSTIFASLSDVARNKNAMRLLGIFFLEMLGFHSMVVVLPYMTEYVLREPGSTAYFLAAATFSTIASIPFWVWISKRTDKAKAWRAAILIKIVVFGAMLVVGRGDSLLMGVITFTFGIAHGASQVLGPSLKADVIDTDEASSGERKEGVFFAAWNFAIKASIGIAIVISGWMLSATGFEPGVAQSEMALTGIRALVSAAPLICHILAIILLLKFSITVSSHTRTLERTAANHLG